MEFEWDEAKSRSNLAKHGVDLQRARLLFDGRPILERAARSSLNESRMASTGEIGGDFYTAIWTLRGGAVRLISVRCEMRKSGNTIRCTAREIDERLARGEERTDVERVRSLTEDELEASIDWEDEGRFEWVQVDDAMAVAAKHFVSQFDADVVDWFADKGPDYARRMTDILRDFISAQETMPSAAD